VIRGGPVVLLVVALGVYEVPLKLLGRDATLTERTEPVPLKEDKSAAGDWIRKSGWGSP